MSGKAIIYVRVSSEEQGEKYSLPSQEAACRDHAASQGYTVEAVITDTQSGEGLERAGLERLFAMVAERAIAVVIVYHLDRLTRGGPAHFAIIDYRLQQHGVRLEIVLGGYRSGSPEAVMAAQFQAIVGWYENQQRRERSVRGQNSAAKAGKVMVGPRPPYGYSKSGDQLVIDPDQAAVVRQIFAWAAEGVSVHEITRRLCALEVPTWADQNPSAIKRNAPGVWGTTSVRRMLASETYVGIFRFRKRKTVRTPEGAKLVWRDVEEQIAVDVPAIIDAATFDAVQERLKRNAKPRPRAEAPSLLYQRVICTCGQPAVTEREKAAYFYRCRHRPGAPWRQACSAPMRVRAGVLDEAVWQALVSHLLAPQHLRAWVERQRSERATVVVEQRRMLAAGQAALANAERQLGILLDQILAGEGGAEDGGAEPPAGQPYVASVLDEERRRLLRLRQDLQNELARMQTRLDAAQELEAQEASVLRVAQQLRNGLAEIDLAAQRQVLELLQVRVRMTGKKSAEIEALIPLALPVVHLADPGRSGGAGGEAGANRADKTGQKRSAFASRGVTGTMVTMQTGKGRQSETTIDTMQLWATVCRLGLAHKRRRGAVPSCSSVTAPFR